METGKYGFKICQRKLALHARAPTSMEEAAFVGRAGTQGTEAGTRGDRAAATAMAGGFSGWPWEMRQRKPKESHFNKSLLGDFPSNHLSFIN